MHSPGRREETVLAVRPVSMYQHPSTHLAIARERQQDLVREARRHELARRVADERPGLVARLRAFVGTHAARRPVARPA